MSLLSDCDITQIEALANEVKEATSILFITGAGLSADSELPTYRGIGGWYNDQPTEEGVSIEEALSGSMLKRRPEVTWKHIGNIEASCRDAQPNRGHYVIAEMEAHFHRVWTLTQNVDGFHTRAGARNVIDIHGNVHRLKCTQCDYRKLVDNYIGLDMPPQCPRCGSLVRPDVVLFEEMLPSDQTAQLHQQLQLGFDVVLSVGTSSLFPYIVQPVILAKRWGLTTVEINPGRTDISAMVDYKISAGAAASLDALWRRVQELT